MNKTNSRSMKIYAAICCTFLLLSSMGVFRPIGEKGAAMIFFLETGHILERPAVTEPEETQPQPTTPEETAPEDTEPEETEPEQTQPPRVPLFSDGDAELVQLQNYCGYTPDIPAWLSQPLFWELQQTQPTVLILHSHGTESYQKTENYTESSAYRTLNTGYNVVSIGDELTRLLEQAGIGVIHDRSMHDNPSYNDSYDNARNAAQSYLDQYPSIRLVLDLHRDSVADSSGKQLRFALETDDGTAAKMMFVMGTDAGGQNHPKWSENMGLAVKLQALLEKENPGICRPISFRSQRFNQDLSTGMVLVEMGSAGNTRQEALLSAKFLADAIITLANGTE